MEGDRIDLSVYSEGGRQMNKEQFLSAVETRLKGLPAGDIKKALDYYSELIDDRVEDGMSEEEAVASLGSPDEVANQILMDMPIPKLVGKKMKTRRSMSVLEIVLLTISSPMWVPLLLAAIVVVIAFFIVLWSVIISFYAAVISVGASAFAGLVTFPVLLVQGYIGSSLFMLSTAFVCAGLAIFMFIGVNRLSWLLIKFCRLTFIGIKSLIIGKRREDI